MPREMQFNLPGQNSLASKLNLKGGELRDEQKGISAKGREDGRREGEGERERRSGRVGEGEGEK